MVLAAESTGESDSDNSDINSSGSSNINSSDSSDISDSSDSSASPGVKGPRKAPRAKSKGKVPKGAQQNAPKARGAQAKKPRVTPGAGQGKKVRPKKAAPVAAK